MGTHKANAYYDPLPLLFFSVRLSLSSLKCTQARAEG